MSGPNHNQADDEDRRNAATYLAMGIPTSPAQWSDARKPRTMTDRLEVASHLLAALAALAVAGLGLWMALR